ncbi:T9SS type A sorting domain-containing protein [Xanthomarina spongicola]|uniref:Putative secreted protein (Por secretion system target) n=1 Tax=Xanthomarina spongicola TaxID=570520 RepID=A0A316DML3_9FLAO|nr:T9SS type A sorting domain-containing protein [Xanthomarina spongicola]PWK18976.1 putative secreted protein (Por secretion system target) [Xanthomarina spongicola]
MKKIYFLLFALMITSLSFGQVIVAEDFSYPDGSLVPNGGWTTGSGTAGDLLVSSGQAVVQHGTPSEDARKSFTSVSGDIYFALDFSVDDLGAAYVGTDNEYFAHVNFNARLTVGPGTSGGDYTVGIKSSSAGQPTWWATDLTYGQTYRAVVRYDQDLGLAQLWIDPANAGSTSVSGTEDGANSIDSFDLRQSDSSENETVRVDDLMIGQTFDDVLVYATPTEPSLTINTPAEGAVFTPGTTSVNLSINVQNFNVGATTGGFDGHIHWTINGTAQSMKYDTNDETIPVTDGQSYTVFMQLVDNVHAPIVPAVEATVNFSVAAATPVADLAALRADYIANGSGAYYQLANTPTVTYTRTSRNQKYIQDASAGILIDDTAGNITPTFAIGDGMSGLMGQASEFNGVLQFIPVSDATVTTGATITPQVVTISDLLADWEPYESELIQINNTSFTDAGGTFATSTNYDITDPTSRGGGSGPMTFRPFNEADYIGQTIPTGMIPLVALVAEFGGAPQVSARSLTDFTLSTTSYELADFNVYPNPTSTGSINIVSKTNDAIEVAVYDILGKQVLENTVKNNRLDVSTLNAGVYIMKISQNGNSITKKLVVR